MEGKELIEVSTYERGEWCLKKSGGNTLRIDKFFEKEFKTKRIYLSVFLDLWTFKKAINWRS